MKESAPEWGAGSDDSTGRPYSTVAGGWEPSDGHRGGCVRTGSSNADAKEDCPLSDGSFSISSLASSSRSQSEGDLAVREAAERRAERRPSGKSDGTRSDRRETRGGSGAGLSAGWRSVVAACHAWEGAGHE